MTWEEFAQAMSQRPLPGAAEMLKDQADDHVLALFEHAKNRNGAFDMVQGDDGIWRIA